MKLPRDSYIPAGATAIKSDTSSAIVYITTSTSTKTARPVAVGFRGKADKPAFNYSFKDSDRRAVYIAEFFAKVTATEKYLADRKAARKAELAKPQDELTVGDVLRSTWGYDQTNVDYYEVTRLIGKRMVEIREIGATSEDTGYLTGRSVPVPGAYLKDEAPLRKIVSPTGSVKIASYAWASKMTPAADGKYEPTAWSAYA